jgi:hypothetical protein
MAACEVDAGEDHGAFAGCQAGANRMRGRA